MRLFVLIPCLNEALTLGGVIAGVPKVLSGISSVRVVVIDDGSSDGTGDVAASAGATVLRHNRNLGVGAALRTGLAYARRHNADLVVNIDGDGQFDPGLIALLVEPVRRGEVDCTTASRFKDPALVPTMPPVKKWGNRRIAGLVSFLTGQTFHDVSCGFRAYSRSAVRDLRITGNFTYTHEIIMQLAFRGYRIREVPLPVRGTREFGTSRVASDLWRYARSSGGIILNCFRDYRLFCIHSSCDVFSQHCSGIRAVLRSH